MINDLIKQYYDIEDKLKNISDEDFSGLFTGFFESHPNILEMTFYAYADFFADGDPTPFYIRTYSYKIKFTNGENGKLYEDYDDKELEEMGVKQKEQDSIYTNFSKILNNIPDFIVQKLFGSDVSITINRDGKISSEYYGNHD